MFRFQDFLFRGHKPRYAYKPLSPIGASAAGGRFNRPGVDALYTALDAGTALAELQDGKRSFPPKTIVCYRADIDNVLDLTNPAVLSQYNIDPKDLSVPWEAMAITGGPVPSWDLADKLIAIGCFAIIVPSFAQFAPADGKNCVIFKIGTSRPSFIAAHDPTFDLPRDESSWP